MSELLDAFVGHLGVGRDGMAALDEVAEERLPDRGRRLGLLDRPTRGRTLRLRRRSPTRSRAPSIASMVRKPADWNPDAESSRSRNDRNWSGRHRLEHIDLRDQRLEDLQDAVEQVEGAVGVARLERQLDTAATRGGAT